jgi:hypothetical protein
MIAPVAKNMDDTDDAPVLQFAETVADVGASDAQGGGNFLGRERPGGEKKQSVNLSDGAIYAPTRPHFAPMQDEFLGDRQEFFHVNLLFLSKQKLMNQRANVKQKIAIAMIAGALSNGVAAAHSVESGGHISSVGEII